MSTRRLPPLPAVLVLLALSAQAPAEASRFWRGRAAATPPPAPATGPATAVDQDPAKGPDGRLRLVNKGSHYEAWADNRLPGPLQVRLRLRQADNITPAPALPLQATLPASGSLLLARLYPTDPRLHSQFDLDLDFVPGDPAARPLDHPYRLPVETPRVRVDQGFGGSFSHDDAQNRHALDFAVDEGTPVLAAREGVVLQVESGHAQAGLDRQRYGARANYVRILHPDGSMALYGHLRPDGVLVRPGQRVDQGQRIALSGNTGYSSAPHLHFVVQVNRGMRLESIPVRVVTPQGELKLAREAPAAGGSAAP